MQIRNVTAGTYALILGDDILSMNTAKIYLQCDTSSGAINILLPKITIAAGGSLQNWWFEVFVNDISGNAATNNITITPNPDNTINGSSSAVVLNANGATGGLKVTGASAWEFNLGSSGSGGSGASPDIWNSVSLLAFAAPSADRFVTFFTVAASTTTEANASFTYNGTSPLTLSRFQVKQNSSANTLNSAMSVTIRKNGVDSALTVSFAAASAANSIQQDNTNTVSVVTGDVIAIKLSSAATSGSLTFVSATLVAKMS